MLGKRLSGGEQTITSIDRTADEHISHPTNSLEQQGFKGFRKLKTNIENGIVFGDSQSSDVTNFYYGMENGGRANHMKVLSINTCNFGSTGKIMLQIQKLVEQLPASMYVSYTKSRSNMKTEVLNSIYIGSILERNIHIFFSHLTGFNGCGSFFSTLRFLRRVNRYNPDLIHLHNLHNSYINLPYLFRYIKKHNIPVIWTFHDCWPFTGHCPYFDMIGCDRWKTGCHDCPQYKNYPTSLFDNSKKMYRLKKKWFTGVKNMTIVTPSQWLADLVKQSHLQDYPVKVINNGIDLSVFKPTPSDFSQKYHCEDKFILLGVAFGWGKRKGLDVFIELSKRLESSYQIVLVGTDESIDRQLPDNIISIHRTQNQTELAKIYTAANLFINPTREENFPTVNIESLACGTPIITFRTGGSPEIIDETCGTVVDKNDIDSLTNEIIRIKSELPFNESACLKRAELFDMNNKYIEYIELYNEECGG